MACLLILGLKSANMTHNKFSLWSAKELFSMTRNMTSVILLSSNWTAFWIMLNKCVGESVKSDFVFMENWALA